MADVEQDVPELIKQVQKLSSENGLDINIKKTNTIVININSTKPVLTITGNEIHLI